VARRIDLRIDPVLSVQLLVTHTCTGGHYASQPSGKGCTPLYCRLPGGFGLRGSVSSVSGPQIARGGRL
jgi:hypothetical protein